MVVTFVIDSDTKTTASILDNRRLGKQRVEASQIIDSLINGTSWKKHPASKSWAGYVDSLKDYCNIMINEWIRRGKNNNMPLYELPETFSYPPWYTNPKIHYSHMSRLIAKDSKYYSDKLKPPVEYLKYGYIWPSKWSSEDLKNFDISVLGEPFVSVDSCIGITKAGINCSNKASYGVYCGLHKPKDFKFQICDGVLKSGLPCKNKAKPNTSRCGIHIKK